MIPSVLIAAASVVLQSGPLEILNTAKSHAETFFPRSALLCVQQEAGNRTACNEAANRAAVRKAHDKFYPALTVAGSNVVGVNAQGPKWKEPSEMSAFEKLEAYVSGRRAEAKQRCLLQMKTQQKPAFDCGAYRALSIVEERMKEIKALERERSEAFDDPNSGVRGAPCYEGSTAPRCQ